MIPLSGFRRTRTAVLCAALIGGGLAPAQSNHPPVTVSGGQRNPFTEARPLERFSVRRAKAPAPKRKPRDGVIVVSAGDGPAPRLFTPDGALIGELAFENIVLSCTLSPNGAQMAAIVREPPGANPDGKLTFAVYVVPTGAEQKETGQPLASALNFPIVAWSADGSSLYVSEVRPPPQGTGFNRPGGVALYDLAKRTATTDRALQSYRVKEATPDGKRLLVQRFVTEPEERWETVLLDAATLKPVDVGAAGVWLTRFFGPNKLLGKRAKAKGAPNETEHVIFDLEAKKAVPLPFPKAVSGEKPQLFDVLSSPDGKRLLLLWDEEVTAPPDWPFAGTPCRVMRMTISDPTGDNARTIFKPDVKQRMDHVRNHVFSTDWR